MKVILRKICEKDGSYIVKWRNSDHVKEHCIDKKQVTLASNMDYFENKISTGECIQYVVERMDEEYGVFSYPIGTIYLKNLDYTNKKCELGFFPSDDEEWNDESKKMAVDQLLEKVFGEFDFHKVYVCVLADCEDELDLFYKAGFKKEGILLHEIKTEQGTYKDIVRLYALDDRL